MKNIALMNKAFEFQSKGCDIIRIWVREVTVGVYARYPGKRQNILLGWYVGEDPAGGAQCT